MFSVIRKVFCPLNLKILQTCMIILKLFFPLFQAPSKLLTFLYGNCQKKCPIKVRLPSIRNYYIINLCGSIFFRKISNSSCEGISINFVWETSILKEILFCTSCGEIEGYKQSQYISFD